MLKAVLYVYYAFIVCISLTLISATSAWLWRVYVLGHMPEKRLTKKQTTLLITACLALALIWIWSDGKHKKGSQELSINDMLYMCSPFINVTHKEMMIFYAEENMVVIEKVNTLSDDILSSEDKTYTQHKFITDEVAQEVTINSGDTNAKFAWLITPDINQCILVHGSLKQADLQQSWFGSPDVAE